MRDILAEILAHKRLERDVAVARELPAPILASPAMAIQPARSLEHALRQQARANRLAGGPGVAVIAEFKRQSPSRGDLGAGEDVAKRVAAYEEAGAAAISVLTEARYFGARPDDLPRARSSARLPILRKDFLLDERELQESRLLGADAVLLIARALPGRRLGGMCQAAREAGLEALVEVADEAELEAALETDARLIGVNNRDLRSFRVSLDVTERLAAHLARRGVTDRVLVSESGIAHAEDVARVARAGAMAVLVGEALMRAPDPRPVLRGLGATEASVRVLPDGRRLWVKICGVRDQAGIEAAIGAGADAVGFVFAPMSRRYLEPARAAELSRRAYGRVARWGVFLDHGPEQVAAVAREVDLDAAQLHGGSAEDLGAVRAPAPNLALIVAVPGTPGVLRGRQPSGSSGRCERPSHADALVVDRLAPDGSGGSGRALDWSRLQFEPERPWILAGGLTPSNVGQAVRALRPDGVDVSSGVERDGVKDPRLIEAFVAAARKAAGSWAASGSAFGNVSHTGGERT